MHEGYCSRQDDRTGERVGFPDGQPVAVTVYRLLPPGEGIRDSAGAWADAGETLDAWLAAMQRSRQDDRAEPAR